MNPEEKYVRQATRGLHGQARRETQAELLDHIAERTRQLTLSGHSPEQARTQAMQELGAPAAVASSLRREQGFTAAGQLALGTLVGLTLLASLTAHLYAQGNAFVTGAIDHAFARDPGWVDPCAKTERCVPLYSGAPLTDRDIRQEGLIRMNEADAYLRGTGLSVRGLLRKSLTLSGAASVPAQPFSVGRDGKPGLQKGYLNLPRALVDGAQQGWPVRLERSGETYLARVGGKVVGGDSRLALPVAATYLRDILNRQFTAAVREEARITAEKTWWKPVTWAVQPGARPQGRKWATLAAPNRAPLYAAVIFEPERHPTPNATFEPSLSAFLIPNQDGTLSLPTTTNEDTPRSLRLVNSRAHFLKAVGNGQRTAVLLRFSGDLQAQALDIVPLEERDLSLTRP